MTRERGPQRSPLSPIRNRGGAATADAVGSSTKDNGWQSRRAGAVNQPSRMQPALTSAKPRNKKVEGIVATDAGQEQHALPANRIPAASRPLARASTRIPRPPAPGASPAPDYAAMLSAPTPPAQQARMQGSSWPEAVHTPPDGFHAYSNPSFDGASFLAPMPDHASPQPIVGSVTGSAGQAAGQHDSGLAAVEAAAGQLTPGLLEPAALTPSSERSLQAWLRGSPAASQAAAAARQRGGQVFGSAPPAAPAGTAHALPTPEAWQLLQHIHNDSPAAAPMGVRGIMNAFLRTGPQQLSPEPSCADVIYAPGVAAVPASGLLNIAGPGGVGVYGLVNAAAYLRTGASMLSPEPGAEAAQEQQGGARTLPPLHPYSPASPLAPTPGGPRAAAPTGGRGPSPSAPQPISPSVCSNGDSGSVGPAPSISLGGVPAAPSPVPRLSLEALRGGQAAEAEQVSLGGGAGGHLPDSPDGELPTVRLLAAAADQSPAQQQRLGENKPAVGAAAQRACQRPPCPVTFSLPADSPTGAACHQGSAAPSFSFGMGAAAPHEEGGCGRGEQGAAGQQGPGAAAEEAGAAVPGSDELRRAPSGETVQQPHPFTAMLRHLRAPPHASPARPAAAPRPDSPQSPKDCTPLHLISASAGEPAAGSPAVAASTPAPGQGSLTLWLDRRGMRSILSTPARSDLRLLWAAARDVAAFQSEAAALRAHNAALAEELEGLQAALREVGAEREAAVVAAEAGALCAEAEAARARDAAGHMMVLADQVQGMFALCEGERDVLVSELEAAQQQLAASEAAASGTAHLGEQQAAALQQQLDEARQAVAAAQAAADAAQQRAGAAATELETIRRQLAEAQQQLAAARNGGEATPTARLRCQLAGVHDSLAQLHAEQATGRVPATSPELERLLEASRGQLAHVDRLLGGGDAEQLRSENARLQRCLATARGLLAQSSPASGLRHSAAGLAAQEGRSPVPFVLFGDGEGGGEGGGRGWPPADSPATTLSACSSDLFSSPYLASRATLTVDYRDLKGSVERQREAGSALSHGSPTPSSAASSAAAASPRSEGGSTATASPAFTRAASGAHEGLAGADAGLWREPGEVAALENPAGAACSASGGGGSAVPPPAPAEAEFTVVHGGMVITHVPASQVSKVRSMVQYWEAVASGTPLGAAADEAAEAEAYASAAVAAAEAALAQQQLQQEQAETEHGLPASHAHAGAPAGQPCASCSESQPGGWQEVHEEGGSEATAGHAAEVDSSSPLARHLPKGLAATPASAAALSAAATPTRSTPLNFATAPPPTPASTAGIDPQQAQQLHQLAVSSAAAAAAGTPHSPASLPPASSAPPSTPARTPAASMVAVAVTPLALSALRARLSGSGGGVQDAVRGRLARLKADLQAAQAKLATVDQGLASIAFTPTPSRGPAPTPGSRGSSQAWHPPSPPPGSGALGSPLSGGRTPSGASPSPQQKQQQQQRGSPSVHASSCAAGVAAACSRSPQDPASASPAASRDDACIAGAEAAAAPPSMAASAAAPAGVPGTAGGAGLQTSTAPPPSPPAEHTPPPTRRSVRFADAAPLEGSSCWAQHRAATPYSGAAAGCPEDCPEGDGEEAGEGAAALRSPAPPSASPVVASNWRSPLGGAASCGAPPRLRSPLAAAQSAAKPAGPAWRWALEEGGGGSAPSSDEEAALDAASRMARGANRAGTPPLAGRQQDAATPLAHPESFDFSGRSSPAWRMGGGTPASAATSVLSASSFSPPRPLVLMAVRPLGRARRGALMRGGGAAAVGRRRSDTDEREFRRRAAALNIQISPYFRRPRGAQGEE